MDNLKDKFKVEKSISVQTYDIDFAGHVSNIVYLRWLEDMRLQFFEKYYSLEKCMQEGYVPVLVSTTINYKKPIRMFDKVHAIMWISKIGKTSLTFAAQIFVNNELATEATHVGVFVDKETMRPRRLPGAFIDTFSMQVNV